MPEPNPTPPRPIRRRTKPEPSLGAIVERLQQQDVTLERIESAVGGLDARLRAQEITAAIRKDRDTRDEQAADYAESRSISRSTLAAGAIGACSSVAGYAFLLLVVGHP